MSVRIPIVTACALISLFSASEKSYSMEPLKKQKEPSGHVVPTVHFDSALIKDSLNAAEDLIKFQ